MVAQLQKPLFRQESIRVKSQAVRTCTAFDGVTKIAHGPLIKIAVSLKNYMTKNPKATVLIFDDQTSRPVEIDLRGTTETILRRIEQSEASDSEIESQEAERKPGPGRPKLGVIAKEVTLLPQHWEWLSQQPGGASVTLRKLVEEARKKNHFKDQLRQKQEAIYNFMTAMAGDLPYYEEALRALYGKDSKKFASLVKCWPKDIRAHTLKLAKLAF